VAGTRASLEIRPFADDVMDDAARLLAERHRAQRRIEPGLSMDYEDVATTRAAIETIAASDGASGAVAIGDGVVVGYLLGAPRPALWGPNVWIEGAGHAVAEPEIVRDLYASAATRWVEERATSHYAVVPATDPALVDAWFRVGFGQQHVHAIREPAALGQALQTRAGIVIRRAERRDISMLGRLEVTLPEHQTLSPVFSGQPLPSLEDATNEWEEGFGDPAFATFVAEHDGRVVGSAVGCAIEQSAEHRGIVRPTDAGFLGFAAVLPEARGLGAGRALGEAVLIWARDAGHPTVVTDWRETNLLSSRAWPALGFRPTFRRLFRAIV
jgi:GNAT superfamily N-acetyltransferase